MADAKKHPFDKIPDEQKETFLAYINAFLKHKSKEKFVSEIPSGNIRNLATVVTTISSVSERRLRNTKSNKEFKFILKLLRASQKNGEILYELRQVYAVRKRQALRKFEIALDELKKKILRGQYQNYVNPSQKSKNKHATSEKIIERVLSTCTDSKLVEKWHRLSANIAIFRCDADFKLSPDLLRIESKDFDVIEYLAYLIYKPEERIFFEPLLDPQWDKFPLKWADHLSMVDVKTLFDMYKIGEDISLFYVTRFEKTGIASIRELAKDPLVYTPFSKNRANIQEAINQSLSCYESRHFMAFMCIILPIIEGILWEYSIYLNTIGEAKIYAKPNQIITTDGKIGANLTIGLLMRHSAFQNFYDQEFIEYFCNELYSERNLILHGRLFNSTTIENAARKLATLEYLLISIRGLIEKKIISKFNKVISPDAVKKILEQMKKDKLHHNLNESSIKK